MVPPKEKFADINMQIFSIQHFCSVMCQTTSSQCQNVFQPLVLSITSFEDVISYNKYKQAKKKKTYCALCIMKV